MTFWDTGFSYMVYKNIVNEMAENLIKTDDF